MRLHAAAVHREIHGEGPAGEFYTRDAAEALPLLLERFAEEAALVYMDPPFMTGQTFYLRQRYGEEGYREGHAVNVEAYHDFSTRRQAEYMELMRRVLKGCRGLLCGEGTLYVHVDQRLSAHIRLLLDEVFGARRFLNEIIWHYKSGGRSLNSFSHKHDNILSYAKGEEPYFNVHAVSEKRGVEKRNNMKRVVGEDGHVYFTIKSGGKTYAYSEDDPMSPGDVWDDIPHLQQKDPERTGYDTQKPEKLLERIILASSPEGGLVADLFAGSGTTCVAAAKLGRRFIGCDSSGAAEGVVRKRLLETGKGFILHPGPAQAGAPGLSVRYSREGEGYGIQMLSYAAGKGHDAPEKNAGIQQMKLEDSFLEGERLSTGTDHEGYEALDYWAAGYIREGAFTACRYAFRTPKNPALETLLHIPPGEGAAALHTVDAYGNSSYFIIEN